VITLTIEWTTGTNITGTESVTFDTDAEIDVYKWERQVGSGRNDRF